MTNVIVKETICSICEDRYIATNTAPFEGDDLCDCDVPSCSECKVVCHKCPSRGCKSCFKECDGCEDYFCDDHVTQHIHDDYEPEMLCEKCETGDRSMNDETKQRIVDLCDGPVDKEGIGWPTLCGHPLKYHTQKEGIWTINQIITRLDGAMESHFIRWLEGKLFEAGCRITRERYEDEVRVIILGPHKPYPHKDSVERTSRSEYHDLLDAAEAVL